MDRGNITVATKLLNLPDHVMSLLVFDLLMLLLSFIRLLLYTVFLVFWHGVFSLFFTYKLKCFCCIYGISFENQLTLILFMQFCVVFESTLTAKVFLFTTFCYLISVNKVQSFCTYYQNFITHDTNKTRLEGKLNWLFILLFIS